MDITQLILDDHHEQRRLFAMLEQIGSDQKNELAAVWKRLAAFLEVHAAAEEQLFYPALLHLGTGIDVDHPPSEETEDAIKDHNDIRDAVEAVTGHEVGSDGWFEAVQAANKANGDHMAEEEREGLTDFRRNASAGDTSQARRGLRSLRGVARGRRRAHRQGPGRVHLRAPARRRLNPGLELGVDSNIYPPCVTTIAVDGQVSGLTVAALAAAVGVGRDTIRYYEKVGLLPRPPRTSGDHRRYPPAEVDRLRFIQGCQRLGLRLDDIRNLLEVRDTGRCACEPAEALLGTRLTELDAELARLQALRWDLELDARPPPLR